MILATAALGVAWGQARVCHEGPIAPGAGEDLEIIGPCTAGAGIYRYAHVNIYAGGSLTFADEKIDFWASAIIVENRGSLLAGTPADPIGSHGGQLTIHLYGRDQGTGGAGPGCKTDERCGVDEAVWNSAGQSKVDLPGGVTDYFYAYKPLMFDTGNPLGYFGYKVLGVGYGGTLHLYGAKGAIFAPLADSNSGRSWARLDQTVGPGATTIRIDRPVDWQPGDQIVVTTTDYLPNHSEQLTIVSVEVESSASVIEVREPLRHPHNGKAFDLSSLPSGVGPVPQAGSVSNARFAETRAAVALLSRSIRIVSEGSTLGEPFPAEEPGQYFGGHVIFRQGFQSVQIQGVEFFQLGQGGKMGHYPVHFHMARQTPPDTMIADSSIHDSMTRWITIHGSHGVLVQRNVGYKSIGHGFYLEDGTEINNRFYSNIGILARAAVQNPQNPRHVPGILSKPYDDWQLPQEDMPYHSDVDHPSVYWITNTYNEFAYNMAAGAGTCGACFWLVPSANSGISKGQKWEGYAAMQDADARAAMTPTKRFEGNYCSTAMNALQTVGNTTACLGIVNSDPNAHAPRMEPVPNPYPVEDPEMYYPRVDGGGGRFPTLCPEGEDCSKVPKCRSGATENCAVTVIERFTTSFNWTETNFSAVWLRPHWYLFTNGVITDVQNGGLTFVTGGGYTKADVVDGHWALAKNSAFIGNAQSPADNPYASNAGPVNPHTPLTCATQTNSTAAVGNFCLLADEGISLPMSNFALNQRLFNIYDGPAYQESNAYLNIARTTLEDCTPQPNGGGCNESRYMYGRMMPIPKSAEGSCYLPNAAIAWKQPNGFYYPPAFHSSNLFFQDVDIRHYVIQPRFLPGTLYQTDTVETAKRYCTWNPAMFFGFTDIDRQTELSDDDGSLTGLVGTVSVNQDPFFHAPVQTAQCASDVAENTPPGTAVTSPYDYVTTAIIPECGYGCTDWSIACSDPFCYGVPLYRQYALPGETSPVSIRMAGQATAQRSSMTMNGGRYYIDTTVSADEQRRAGANSLNVFQPGQTYYTMLLFATPKTVQTYQMYVGPGFNPSTDVFVARGKIDVAPVTFEKGGAWPSTWPKPQYDPNSGLLTVTVDMSFSEFQSQYSATKKGRCGPRSFCSLNPEGECASSLHPDDPLYAESGQVCSRWAQKDVDCPTDGCYAFGVRMPAGFTTGPKPNLPPPMVPFPTSGPFARTFTTATEATAGKQCYYPAPPLR